MFILRRKVGIILLLLILILAGGYFYLDHLGKEAGKMEVEDIDFSAIEDGAYYGNYTIGPVRVETNTVIKDGKIVEIQLIDHMNGLGEKGEQVIPSIVESQSLKVDTITGATGSSMAIIKSVEESLQGKENKKILG